VIDKARHLKMNMPLKIEQDTILLCPETDQEFLNIKNELANVMSDKVGIVRHGEGLKSALEQIEMIASNYTNPGTDYNYHKIINLTDICRVITLSAIEREESRGGHVRTDFPLEIDGQLHHIIQKKGMEIKYEAIRT
jgi:L-aspartate oxidase